MFFQQWWYSKSFRVMWGGMLMLWIVISSLGNALYAMAQTPSEPVRVMVTLRNDNAPGRRHPAGTHIVQAQRAVLADVTPDDFQPLYRYVTLPGLAGWATPEGIAALRRHPDVQTVTLDIPVFAAGVESAPLIRAPQARAEFGVTGKGVTVAILDSGIDLTHPDLAGRIVAQQCFNHRSCPPHHTDTGPSAQDELGHGTHVAGIIAGHGTVAPMGIAPDVGIVAVRVLNNQGAGWTSDIIAAIDWVIANQSNLNVRLINLSLGSKSYAGVCDAEDANTQLFAQVVAAARAAGIAVFAASGNRGEAHGMMMPACIGDVVSVGSVYDAVLGPRAWDVCIDNHTAPDQVSCFSNSSPTLDLLAPGAWIVSTALGGGQKGDAGTSMSVPHVVGVAALMLEANPALTPAALEAALKNTGVPLTDARNGRVTPRVDAWAAVQAVVLPPPTPAPAPRVISGTVTLQGRNTHNQIDLTLSTTPCAGQDHAPATLPQTLTAQTDAQGHFTMPTDPAIAYRCLAARVPRYLEGQMVIDPATNHVAFTLLAGDVNADNRVDIFDLVYVAVRLDSNDAAADLNADGQVNIFDLTLIATNYNQPGPIVYAK